MKSIVVLFIFLFIFALTARAEQACVSLFSTSNSSFDESISSLISQNKLQEAIWEIRRQGFPDDAKKLESQLRSILVTDKIKRIHFLGEILSENDGTTEALHILFHSGVSAVAKYKRGDGENRNAPRSEIAAYEVSQLFQLHNVPMTVKRKIRGQQMSVQYFVRDLPNGFSRSHRYHPESWLTDYLIAYSDMVSSRFRNKADNYLLDNQDRQILIDNASGFNTDWQSGNKALAQEWETLLYALNKEKLSLKDIAPSREVFAKLKAPTSGEIRNHFHTKLPKQEIENLILRRDHYVKKMSQYIK
ncbi:MAG: hypothetical protein V4596_14095 [Bdellovibrionota bacterium]